MCINVLTLKIEKKTRLLYSTSDAPQSISCVQGVLQDHRFVSCGFNLRL